MDAIATPSSIVLGNTYMRTETGITERSVSVECLLLDAADDGGYVRA